MNFPSKEFFSPELLSTELAAGELIKLFLKRAPAFKCQELTEKYFSSVDYGLVKTSKVYSTVIGAKLYTEQLKRTEDDSLPSKSIGIPIFNFTSMLHTETFPNVFHI